MDEKIRDLIAERNGGVSISDEHEANLRKLAKYLMTVEQVNFDMQVYFVHQNSTKDVTDVAELIEENCHTCGTVACAVGHGPMAGIPSRHYEYSWGEYSERVFGLLTSNAYGAWDWCFDALWAAHDNTPQGAAKRILYMLEHGVPANYRPNCNSSLYEKYVELYNR